MAKCDSCRALIAWGGVKDGSFRYCSERCTERGRVDRVTQAVPRELLERYLQAVYEADCPQCGGAGPLDVYDGHGAWSALADGLGNRLPPIGCRGCGAKAELRAVLSSAALGWWLPFELVLMPLAITRSIARLAMSQSQSGPSRRLEKRVKVELALVAFAANADSDKSNDASG